MGKLILIIIVILLAYWLIKSRKKNNTNNGPLSELSEDMVRCEQCGVHLPKSESIFSDDNFFCSDEHYQKYLESKL